MNHPTSNTVLNALQARRSHHHLGKELPIPVDDVVAMITGAIKLSPSAFNSQGSRAVVLIAREGEKLWSLTKEILRQFVDERDFAATDAKIDRFAAAAGTVLFYEDIAVIADLQQRFLLYGAGFPEWAEQSNGMAQLSVWLALSQAGIGASLQHYNPLIDKQVSEVWGIAPTWKLRAQMPFGIGTRPVQPKSFVDDESRFRVFR